MRTRVALSSALAAGGLSILTVAAPASANCSQNGKDVGNGCDNDPPAVSATPELDSLALLGTGVVGLAGYTLVRVRANRRRSDED